MADGVAAVTATDRLATAGDVGCELAVARGEGDGPTAWTGPTSTLTDIQPTATMITHSPA